MRSIYLINKHQSSIYNQQKISDLRQLLKTSNVTRIDIKNQKTGYDNIKEISDLLSNTKIQALSFCNSELGSIGVAFLFHYGLKNPNLFYINAHNNNPDSRLYPALGPDYLHNQLVENEKIAFACFDYMPVKTVELLKSRQSVIYKHIEHLSKTIEDNSTIDANRIHQLHKLKHEISFMLNTDKDPLILIKHKRCASILQKFEELMTKYELITSMEGVENVVEHYQNYAVTLPDYSKSQLSRE
ncbi:MAG: hypothetical protein ACK5AV_03780 [Alphaproteobacteria bacterium]